MRPRHRTTLGLLRSLQLLGLGLSFCNASPVQTEPRFFDLNNVTLAARAVPCSDGTLCGYYDQVCCRGGSQCYTNRNNIALCGAAPTPPPSGGGGHWEYYTKTWVETNRITRTRVYSSYVGWTPATSSHNPETTQKPAICYYGQKSCGPICCKSWQVCVVDGQCGDGYGSYSAPVRPTSHNTLTLTNTVRRTTTVGFQPAETGHNPGGVMVGGSTSSTTLSGGAIAGIVIGVIVGIIILIILCLILCFGAAWNAVLAFFGLGRRRRRETVEVSEYHRHGSRADGRQWYGGGGSRPGRPPPPKKKKDSGFGWGTIILGLGALWAALGFKRRRDRKKREEKSDYSSSYGYYSDTTSSSSDRRTRDTRRSSRR